MAGRKVYTTTTIAHAKASALKSRAAKKKASLMPDKETSASLLHQIDDLRVEAARLLSESEKTKRTAEKIADKIKRLEKLATKT
jgi:hypothetical protein